MTGIISFTSTEFHLNNRLLAWCLVLGMGGLLVISQAYASPADTLTPPELEGKIFAGYQGWFDTPNDGIGWGWGHWGVPAPHTLDVDNWPDISEYPPNSLMDSGLTMQNGQPAKLFSSVDPQITDLHVKWMKDYGIDGAFLQWFVGNDGKQLGPTGLDKMLNNRTRLLENFRTSTEKYGRKFAITFDVSGIEKSPYSYDNRAALSPGLPKFAAGSINLKAGQSKVTDLGTLAMQTDGNLVFYDVNKKPLWASNTARKTFSGDYQAKFQGDGNLVLYQGSIPYWASNTTGHQNSDLTLCGVKPYLSIIERTANLVVWPLAPERYNVDLCLTERWKYLVDTLHITESSSYLKANGKPLLEIWGFGFTDRHVNPEQAMKTIKWFTHDAPPKYRVTLMGGVPRYWRTRVKDAQPDPAWAAVYRSFDIISPWRAGDYNNQDEARQAIRTTAAGDVAALRGTGQGYMPVIFPGFSCQCWPNWRNDPSLKHLNVAPRMGGKFMWTQAFEFSRLGVQTMYVGMFDEMSEGTAILKLAPTAATTPGGCHIVAMDADGFHLPSDWYLQVSRAISDLLKANKLFTAPNLPIHNTTDADSP